MAKISGNLNDDCRVIILDHTTGALVSDTDETAPSYEVTSLSSDNKIVIGVNSSTGESQAFSNVTPAGELVESSIYLASGNDDSHVRYNSDFSTTSSDVNLTDNQTAGFFCFSAPMIQGAIIHEARLNFVSNTAGWSGNHTIYIACIDEDNPVQPLSGNKATYNAYSKTSYLTWVITDPTVNGASRTTPDLKSLVQTVVDRPGWSPNNRLAIGLYANTSFNLYTGAWSGTGIKAKAYDSGDRNCYLYVNWEG